MNDVVEESAKVCFHPWLVFSVCEVHAPLAQLRDDVVHQLEDFVWDRRALQQSVEVVRGRVPELLVEA